MVEGEIGKPEGWDGWIGMRGSETEKGEKGSQEAVKCGQDNYPAAWESLAQGARLEAVTAHTDITARQQTIGMEGHGFWPGVCLFSRTHVYLWWVGMHVSQLRALGQRSR